MKHESDPLETMQALWKAQPDLPLEVDMDRIQSDAAALERTLKARNRRERFVAWPLAVFFAVRSLAAFASGNTLSGVGALIVAGSALWILYVLRHSEMNAESESELAQDGRSFLTRYRGELIRQRRLLQFAWLWYCLPVFVGLVLMYFGRAAEKGQTLNDWALATPLVVTTLVFLAVAVLNLVAARSFSTRLDELGSVGSGD